jgi:hypothetical protein
LSNQSLKAANLRLKLQPIVDEIVSSSWKLNHQSMFGFRLWPMYKSPLE